MPPGHLKVFNHLMISPKDDFRPKEVVSEMLQGNYNGEQFTPSRTVVLLSAI